MDIRTYFPGLLCFGFMVLGLGTGTMTYVMSVAWAYVAVKFVNHYILKKKPESEE
ncbi:MAG: hypothetical protein IJ225_11040 [Solobacterium sp.]|nr:hypothetical protein [Solobacterium sp.]